MAELAEAIRAITERELDANELALARCFPRPPEMTVEAQQKVAAFVQWCQMQRVRSLPAKPCSVAAFVIFQKDRGVSRPKIADTLEAIEAMHFAAALGTPVATPQVRGTERVHPRCTPQLDDARKVTLHRSARRNPKPDCSPGERP